MPLESTLDTHITADGRILAVHDWMLEPGLAVRGVVLIVHGWGEHAGRYDALAEQLNHWGFAVRGYDQHGHGESLGQRGSLPKDACLLSDLLELIDATRTRMANNVPLVLLGHGMGGVVAAHCLALQLRAIQGLVLSSPALDTGMHALRKLALHVADRCLPNSTFALRPDPALLSHNALVVQAYSADRLVHRRLSARLARYVVEAAAVTLAAAPAWRVPSLLLYAGDDRWVRAAGSRQFAAAAPKEVLVHVCFDTLYHEVLNEPDNASVLQALRHWLGLHF